MAPSGSLKSRLRFRDLCPLEHVTLASGSASSNLLILQQTAVERRSSGTAAPRALPFLGSLPGLSPSLLSWLARSFCFFLLVASSSPRDALLWPGALVLLDIFSRLDETNGPPGSVMESGSGVRRFLPGPAILATLCGQTLWQGTSDLGRQEHTSERTWQWGWAGEGHGQQVLSQARDRGPVNLKPSHAYRMPGYFPEQHARTPASPQHPPSTAGVPGLAPKTQELTSS